MVANYSGDMFPLKSRSDEENHKSSRWIVFSEIFVRRFPSGNFKFKVHSYFPKSYKRAAADRQRCKYVCAILLLLCGDIETNPGPRDVCPVCTTDVLGHHYAIQCDGCSFWFHIRCINMTENQYKTLVKMDSFYSYDCKHCTETCQVHIQNRKRKQIQSPSEQCYVPETKKWNIFEEHSYASCQAVIPLDKVS